MKHLYFLIFLVIIFIWMFPSCEKSFSPFRSEIIYYQSFETLVDISHWEGISTAMMNEDAPPNGGSWSVQITGGCTLPHAYLDLEPLSYDCELIVSFWGKNLSNGGSVSIGPGDFKEDVQVFIDDRTWRYYTSGVYLYKQGQPLRLNLTSGGYVPSSMLIDLVKIERLN